ncbi:hypothetical protein LOD59_02400 [Xylella fastidiosa subsp. multiplex]|uniref:hypothetical protein n=1 Tax=Xylella fastidiosa TaxID=2371 RepID=UPI002360F9F6|nr:hypothetical protein [Xylella fastidiosa]MDD0926524.1 hypothetical protein [Xylella fastidiosa subsp. multiplex]
MFFPFFSRLRLRMCILLRRCLVWHVLSIGTLLLGVAVLMLSKFLADWAWPDSRITQLLQRGEVALAQGNLSAPDGSGARELFETAKALDSDRHEAQDGLLRTGQAALAQARITFDRGQFDAAERYLRLARVLQMPQDQVDVLERLVRQRQAEHADLDQLLVRADEAYVAGRLEGDPNSALPLYQRVLELVPGFARALQGREDALSELLRQACVDLERGQLDAAAAKLNVAQRYDPGHVDLPQTQDLFNRAIDVHLHRAVRLLRRGLLAPAARDFRAVLAVRPEQSAARRGLEDVVERYVAHAGRQAAEFHFEQAELSLARARALLPDQGSIYLAEQALQRARQTRLSLQPKLSKVERERYLGELMGRFDVAERLKEWLTPPGISAYDQVRAAQAIAPADARVQRAAQRLLVAMRACFEEELGRNRLQSAQACLDVWQAINGQDVGLLGARKRLAQRWIAVGSERFGEGDITFARRALEQARRWGSRTPELDELARRVDLASQR